jgi:hypothetical protein
MVLTIKLYSLAWNIYDGHLISKAKKQGTEVTNKAALKCKDFALTEGVPNFLEFLGYAFCFSNVLAGPAFEFSIYKAACDGTLLYDPVTKKAIGGKVPSNFWPTVKPLILSLIFMGAFVIGGGMFPIMDTIDPQHNKPLFLAGAYSLAAGCPFYKRVGYQWISLFFVRMKYYFAWKNAEGANNVWYAGFEGFKKNEVTGKPEPIGWENADNVDVFAFETAPNIGTASKAWNKKTSNWLTRYIYFRTGSNLYATYGMSAFWHGFYPGYYFFFLSMPLLTACERIGRKKLTPIFGPKKGGFNAWSVITRICTSAMANYFIQPFQVLSFEWGLQCLKDNYFVGHIAAVLFLGVMMFVKSPKVVKEGGVEKKRN